MGKYEMVVLIVAIVMIANVLKTRFQYQTAAEPDADVQAGQAQLCAELQQLKQRIATLERIATDGAGALDREIEALRDRP